MTKRAKERGRQDPYVKTSLHIPVPLWQAAKILAVQEHRNFRSIVIAALEAYVKLRRKEH